jgi:hypothetical protein
VARVRELHHVNAADVKFVNIEPTAAGGPRTKKADAV